MGHAPPEHRTAFITGGSSGIGRGLALWFARRGVRVFAAARRMEALTALSELASREGHHITPVHLDVTDTTATVRALEAADDQTGGIDLVIANAGIGSGGGGKRGSFQNAEPMIRTNVLGASATLYALLPRMLERGRGHLVGMSSLAALRGLPKSSAYSASKAFLSTLCESLRLDVEPLGLHVTCLQPGFIRSDLTAKHDRKLPYLLELDDAVEHMGRAILRGDAVFSFPWQLSMPLHTLRALPSRLYDGLARRVL
jgi:short-subunit dehydrogenase